MYLLEFGKCARKYIHFTTFYRQLLPIFSEIFAKCCSQQVFLVVIDISSPCIQQNILDVMLLKKYGIFTFENGKSS